MLWQLIWEKNCQTIVVMGDENCFWTNLKVVGDLLITRDNDDLWIVSNKEDQVTTEFLVVFAQSRNYLIYLF